MLTQDISDYKIRKIALLFSIFGILFLIHFFEGNNITTELRISDINKNFIDKKISVKGIVSWAKLSKGILFFELQDKGNIYCLIFYPTVDEISLVKKGNSLKIKGVVKEYKGNLEIIVEEVVLIGSL
ncbi:MAG: OB-fold nucleic acid binding domain-containing protein [Candidatus Diapherotrites archaeon]|nr:OB-fold nucleic acid binding domain-containing protein [Candidatus Diapherotrites archaeon]